MIATSADVSASERSVSTGVLLRQRVVHVAVPVDWQGMRIEGVVVDAPSVVLQSNIVDPSTSRAAGSATGVGSPIDQSKALGDIPRSSIGRVVDHRGVPKFPHHFGENRGVARSIPH